MKTKFLLGILMLSLFSLSSFSDRHPVKSLVTISTSALNSTSNNATVVFSAASGGTLNPAGFGGFDSGSITYDTNDGFGIDITVSSLLSTVYSHIYIDGSFAATLTHTPSKPTKGYLVITNPSSSVSVVINTTP